MLKDTPFAVNIFDPTAAGAAQIDIHLQNFRGAPTTGIVSAIGGYYQADGGAIKVLTNGEGNFNPSIGANGKVVLHVDTDSTAGLIFGYSQNNVISPSYKGPLPNLTIVGSGRLTAQIGANFTNIDATQAGDLNLSYQLTVSETAQTLRLGDGTNTLKLAFGGTTNTLLTPAAVKVLLGAGTDTVSLATNVFDPAAPSNLANIQIRNNTTVSPPPEIVGFQKGVDHLVLDVQVHSLTANVQQYVDGRADLSQALISLSARVAVNTGAVFTYGGDTYIYAQDGRVGVNMAEYGSGGGLDATGDGLIKLAGVTGLSVGTGAAVVDIHYG